MDHHRRKEWVQLVLDNQLATYPFLDLFRGTCFALAPSLIRFGPYIPELQHHAKWP